MHARAITDDQGVVRLVELARDTAEAVRPYRLAHRVRMAPWHGALHEARDEYLDHIDAWEDFWRAVADEPSIIFNESALADRINYTFVQARDSMSSAMPWPDLLGYGDRVDDAFRD